MDALISGSAGLAATIDGVTVMLYKADKSTPIVSSLHEVNNIFKSYQDTIKYTKTSKNIILTTLQHQKYRSTSLLMLLTILDVEIDSFSKLSLIKYLDEILEDDSAIYSYLLNILFSRPLPENSIKSLPIELSENSNNSKTITLLNSLFESQENIVSFSDLFNQISTKHDLPSSNKDIIEGYLVNNDFFYSVATNQLTDSDLSTLTFSILSKLKELNIPSSVPFGQDFKSTFKKHIFKKTLKSNSYPISKSEQDEHKKYKEKPYTKKKIVNSKDEYLYVTTQINIINDLLNSNKIDKAEQVAKNLIEHQSKGGVHSYAAHSLCNIAGFARNLEHHTLELKWALESSRIAPDDYRTHGHVADAYLSLGKIDKAADYFNKCADGDVDSKIFGLTGLARIEKERFNLDVALGHINYVVSVCGRDPVPYLVKAEILRDKKDFVTAEEVYEYACKEFPENSIPLNGKASLLVAQKKFEDAELIYKDILKNYSKTEDIKVTNCAYGFLLARLGRFKEAHKHLDTSINLSKYEDIIATTSKAIAFKIEGVFNKAESILKGLIDSKPQFPQPLCELLDIYIENNRISDGLKLYEKSPDSIKSESSVQMAYSRLLKGNGNFQEALQIIDNILVSEPRNITAMIERASILKMIGNFTAARRQYIDAMSINRNDLRVRFGLRMLDQIENLDKNNEFELQSDAPQTVDDYQHIGLKGLIELSKGNYKAAKESLVKVSNCPFMSMKNAFSPSLSMANLMLNHKAPSLKAIKKRAGVLVDIQKSIIHIYYGNFGLLKEVLPKNDPNVSRFTDNIIKMIDSKYVSKTDESISENQIYSEQIKNLLIAA
jgi:tetratricopeptide (TPR) repeat protein